MAKNKRGPWAKKEKNWRGTCPVCNRPRVKLLWDKVEGKTRLKVCKICGNNK